MKNEKKIDLSIIRVSSQKIPFRKWEENKKTIDPVDKWYHHYLNQGYVGIVCGKVSGNLEVIDVDVKNDPRNTIYGDYLKLIPESLLQRLLIQSTPNDGLHIIYRCKETTIEENQKLALHEDQSVIIETRGEGGYFCTSTTDYQVIQGKLDLVNLDYEIPVITKEEREFLLETARSLTRYFPPHKHTKNGNQDFKYSEPAINDFNNKYLPIEIFEKHGWKITGEDEEKFYLLRPGSSAQHSGYYFKDSKVFYCFSTSSVFESLKPYNNYQILKLLDGNNDHRKTLNLITNLGYQVSNKKDKITTQDIADYLTNAGARYDEFVQDITLNGNVIEEIDYNTLYINMKNHFDREIPRTRFEEVIKSRYVKTFHPIREFVEKNKNRKPTGTFEKWMSCITLKNKNIDRDVALHFLKKWYVGMIAQSMGGEFPNEFFLALLSTTQGIGKSTFLRKYILPDELREYQVEHSLTFDDDFKVIMGQTLLVIDDEMDGRTYEQNQTFKNVLSGMKMTTRRKYDRRVSTFYRRCSFAGSGNNLNVIREATNRRIIPFEIEKFDYKKLTQVNYVDLFMEAYHLYESGFKYSYQSDDKVKLEHLYQDYLQKSDIELILDEIVELPTDEDGEFISTLDIVTRLSDMYPHFIKRINPMTIGKLMNDRGYQPKRYGVKKISGYLIDKDSQILRFSQVQGEGILLGYKED
jgi:predicted P-loop ATPase